MSKLTITIIRHGESLDNTVPIWAGWKDASLSSAGNEQVKSLGSHFASTSPPTIFDAIYTSPLSRAAQTAEAIYTAHPFPKPPLPPIKNENLREQNFGRAEGHPYLFQIPPAGTDLEKEYYSKGIFPISASRSFKFPEAESLDEVALRAQTAVRQIVVPHLLGGGGHIGIASHGILIREFLEALNRLDPEYVQDLNAGALFTSGLVNSGWTRICLVPKGEAPANGDGIPPQKVHIELLNQHEHLEGLDYIKLHTVSDGSGAGKALLSGGVASKI